MLLIGCLPTSAAPTPLVSQLETPLQPTPTLKPTQAAAEPTAPSPTDEPVAVVEPTQQLAVTPTSNPLDSGWQPMATGIDRRTIQIYSAENILLDGLYLLRIDPAHWRFDVGYSPGEPKGISQWADETGASIVMNGSFYTAEYLATGLTIVNGQASGWSYDYGGMLIIQDGTPTIRSLAQQPWSEGDSADAGLQAFPMLVMPGGQRGYSDPSHQRARRTVIGQTMDDRIIMLVTTRSYFTLPELSYFLTNSDLNLDVAFNLDGGPSTGIVVGGAASAEEQFIPALSLIPAVILVHPR